MIATWMAYALLLSALIGSAAWALDRGAGALRKPRRFVWAAAIAASLVLPVAVASLPRATTALPQAAPLVAQRGGAAVSTPAAGPAAAAPRSSVLSAVWSRVATFDVPLVVLWAAASGLLGLGLLRAAVRLARGARSWSPSVVDGAAVLVAPDVGPAVVRLLSGLKVVLPTWAMEADVASRSLMLRHEMEHRRARDPDLAIAATLALVAVPWNLALWWQVRRLQIAVETDCDRRVMQAGADAHAYGALLLRVGARMSRGAWLAASAFAETPSLLERRIKAMTSRAPRKPVLQAALAGGGFALIVLSAAMMPQPPQLRPQRLLVGERAADTSEFDVLLRVGSKPAGRTVRFKAAFNVDDAAGLQYVDTTTPFQARGRTRAAAAILQKIGGDANLDAALVAGAGADTEKVAGASGSRLVLQYNPRGHLTTASAGPSPAVLGQPPASCVVPVMAADTTGPIYPESSVDERPEYVGGPAPEYPRVLKEAGVQGRVVVQFVVDKSGRPEPGSIVIDSATNPLFERPVIDAIFCSVFRPGRKNSHVVRVRVKQPVNFQLSSPGTGRS